MSLSLVVHTQDDRIVAFEGGELLMAELERVDEVAEQAGLAPLASWADDRPIPEDFDGDADDLATLLGPNPIWHTSPEAVLSWRSLSEQFPGEDDAVLVAALASLISTVQAETPETFQLDVLF